jgi:dihydrofolate synthase/folylpolyglutamate synthase
MFTYQQTIDYLYSSMPMFQREGKSAYKVGLDNVWALCEAVGNPQLQLKTVHIAGTNGKGSSSHYLAAIFHSAGYKVGLFTSPHLKSFTERVRINGHEIDKAFVIQFVHDYKAVFERIKPSFFELTTVLAFKYFAEKAVDIAIVEVGMGGRLDSTNIIAPEISLITNIGLDHMEYLGDTLDKIAFEKAGIIKPLTPVVISEYQHETIGVFEAKAKESNSQLVKAFEQFEVVEYSLNEGKLNCTIVNHTNKQLFHFQSQLTGKYQLNNLVGVLSVIDTLANMGYQFSQTAIYEGVANVVTLTGLKGRWQKIADSPSIYCDTGHNEAGIKVVLEQLNSYKFKQLYLVLGMVNDKSHEKVLSLLPKNAYYVFCQATIPRALEASALAEMAAGYGLKGEVIKDVNEAIAKCKQMAGIDDFILIGGSTFVVADIAIL